MISCPKCAKENQDHYKFCLGCGAELPRSGAPKVFSPQTPPHGMRAVQPSAQPQAAIAHTPPAAAPRPAAAIPRPEPVPNVAPPTPSTPPAAAPAPAPVAEPPAAPAPEPAAAPEQVACPQCGHENIPSNRFCASCGYNLSLARSSAPAPSPSAPAPAPAAEPPANPVKLTALRPDGTDLGTFTLPAGVPTTVGRDAGGIFAGDSYLSPRHATFELQNGKLRVRDEGSLNGVYRKIAPLTPVELVDGSIFRIGQEIVRFEALKPEPPGPDGVERLGSPSNGYVGRIALLIGRETTGNAFPVPEQGIHIGRERGDVLFPEDGYVSGLHCRITVEEGRVWLTDVGSSNGTFLRIQGEDEIQPGEILLMGQQLYRVEF